MEERSTLWELEGYSSDQIAELEEGIKAGLDVSAYENKEYLAIQMRQIRLGIAEGLEVSWYANPRYDWFQMEEIRKGLSRHLDVSIYADVGISYDRMQQIRKGLQIGLDLSAYRVLHAGILREIRYAYINKVNIMPFIKEGYDKEQLEAIRIALEKEIDIEPYLQKNMRGICIQEICAGLEEGLDVSVYAKEEYFWQQMREIRLGMEHMVDVEIYKNPLYSWQQMREIRLGLEEGLDVSYYQSLRFSASDMEKRRLSLKDHVEPQTGSEEVVLPEPVEDENFYVYVTPDEMSAILEIKKEIKQITRADILKVLCNAGVRSGIDYDTIDKIVRQKSLHQPVKIAKGTPMQDGEDGWYEFFFRTEVAKKPKILEDGNVDYRDVEWCETVEKNQKIAYYHIPKSGIHGMTVTGKKIIGKRGKEQRILTGTGFKRLSDGRTYVSTMDGVISIQENRIDITKMLMVDEVSISTGDVNFNGSVLVRGDVRSGAKIIATEDIIVDGFVEGAEITCGGNAILRQGMNASENGFIHAGGDIIGYFFESTEIKAGGTIQGDYFFNCNIHTVKTIRVMGKKGMLAGGTAIADEGIQVYNLGNPAGLYTVVKAGIGVRVGNKEKVLNKKLQEAMHDRLIFEDAHKSLQKKYPPEIRNTMELYLKIESAIYTKEKEMEQILQEKTELDLEKRRAASIAIRVKNEIFDNVLVEIDGMKWMSKNLKSITLYRNNERIIASAYN